MGTKVPVQVDGRVLRLGNLDKPLYPDAGFTKAEVLDYYARIAPVLLPHLAGRPLTVRRCPDGVAGRSFFERNAPPHTPDWVRTVSLPAGARRRRGIRAVIVEDLPTLIHYAGLAALEFHVPQWRVDAAGRPGPPDLLVFDLDPAAPATVVECCRVACLLRERLAADGLTAYPKTSGGRGLHLYAPIRDLADPVAYARELARDLAVAHPDLVARATPGAERPGRVRIDWAQNDPAAVMVAPYSLRVRDAPIVSTPLRWAEVESCTGPGELVFTAPTVLSRVEHHGDLFVPTGR